MVSLLHLAPAEQLTSSLHDVPLAIFVKSVLSDADSTAVAGGLVISALLLDKIPTLYVETYSKEGTCAALRKLAQHAPPDAKADRGMQVRARCARWLRACNV